MSDDLITGSCHCGDVTWEITRPETMVSCNCSACRRFATLWAYAPPATAKVHAGEAATIAYMHGDKMLAFHSCARCGVTTHYLGLDGSRIAVNLRCADDPAALEGIRLRHFDGADSWEFLD